MVRSLRESLERLARNLWWTWNPDAIAIFHDVDPPRWTGSNHDPLQLLRGTSPERLAELQRDESYLARVERVGSQLRRYLATPGAWGDVHAAPLARGPVAYFCAEIGLHESLPIYSGGLGILAGDHLKSASELGVPLVGVGLFYREGYFRQRIGADGLQQAEYSHLDPAELPLEPLCDRSGAPVVIEVPATTTLRARVWMVAVGRVRLFLLDPAVADLPDLSARLYGGDLRARLRQELLLGVGGVRALRAAGIEPGVVHLNEGHSAFAVLELARGWMERDRAAFPDAFALATAHTVFTTHTPVAAGHDRFPPDLLCAELEPYRQALGLERRALLALGRAGGQPDEPFCMTVLALRGASRVNAVSAIHGRISRAMWQDLYPGCGCGKVPIGHITNGVHVPSWLAPDMHELFVRQLGGSWPARMTYPDLWRKLEEVDDAELWETHRVLKQRLLRFVERRVTAQRRRWDGAGRPLALAPEALTIGFARRFATYKRVDLLLLDVERLLRLLDSEHPVQVLFAGKAHPADDPGRDLIARICRLGADPRVGDRLVFLEDYDLNVARHLVQGVDLWLSTPRPPLEACSTSGMKVVLNGGLNLSVLDGWWAEAYDGKNGFAIASSALLRDPAEQDRRDAAELLRVLEAEVIPLYHTRDERGVPLGWVARMKRAMTTLGWRFNSDRMVKEYTRGCYAPAAELPSSDVR